ncbi:MAG: hypothetical protein IIA88_03735, partial [Bacteroidetes bacterium]|nr:hypothetical protein [Bacteroidota bacterium]
LISLPYPYELSVSAHTITSSVSIDPLLGLGLILDVGLTDMLEDHIIYGGILGLTDFRSAKYFAEYHYLKRRVDLSISYDIQNLLFADFIPSRKYRLQEVNFTMSYPFTASKSIRFTPFFVQTRYTDLDPSMLSSSDFVTNFTGYNSEFVVDNSIVYGLNMVEGTRFKVGFKSYFGLKDKENNFNILKIDLRRYQKIHREITLASRISYGYSFGFASKLFLLGGVDNWWFHPPIAFEPGTINLQDANELLFLSFATNLRGFDYNARYGNKYVLFNTELRIPVVRYFNKSVISSSFFRNLQLSTFIDAGTAWSGKSPFNSDNNYNLKVVVGKPFKSTVTNYRNPLISGYGFGIRSMMLGYYMKFDLAWGVEDYQVKKPKPYWTLGYDF